MDRAPSGPASRQAAAQPMRGAVLLIVLSGAIISLCMGLRQSLGLFMQPMTLEAGVSAATFGFSIALQNIVWGLTQPFVGALADRWGARPVLLGTSAIYAGGLLVMTVAAGSFGLELAGSMIGIGIAGTGFGVLVGVVARVTPPERRSQTVGTVAALGSLGTVLIAPMGQALIGTLGWRPALIAFAGVALAMLLLGIFIRDPGSSGAGAGVVRRPPVRLALRMALEHRGFLAMTTAYFACGFQLTFILTHLPQYLALCGISPGLSATALGLIGLFNAVGTYIFGLLGARYSQKRLLALIYLFRTTIIAVFVLVPVSATSTLIFAAAMGLLWLGVAPLVTGILGRLFGLAHFNMLFGLSFLSHQLGSFCGAWIGGVVFDLTGSYGYAWLALLVIGTLAFSLQWSMSERPAREIVAPA